MSKINIAKDFSPTPGPRYKTDGKYSGEEFRETILIRKFNECKRKKEKLLIDLDGGFGYFVSFLEEAFGGLARKINPDEILSILEFKSEEEPSLIDEIKSYIKGANK